MQLISQMHNAGLHHGAMYPRNILMQQLDDGSYTPHIIDTPMALVCYHTLKGDQLASIDLQHFLYTLKNQLPEETMAEALEVYGQSSAAAENLARKIHKLPSQTKHTRNNQRTYARFRSYFIKV